LAKKDRNTCCIIGKKRKNPYARSLGFIEGFKWKMFEIIEGFLPQR
jgi:hypothetical protein